MNIYLDIDGVLLTKQGEPASYLREFLDYIVQRHTPYWLTTHCKGDAGPTIAHLKRKLPPELHTYVQAVGPTNWDVLKTDAIDFTKDFRWLDDAVMQSEEEVLQNHNALHKLISIDLQGKPARLKEIIENQL